MKIRERFEFINKAPLITVKANATAYEVIHLISAKNYGACIIVNDDFKPIGIVTERDFMRRLLDKKLDPNTTLVSEIMTKNVKTASLDDNVVDWMRQMSNERFRHVPVVDDTGKVVNILSQGDLVSYTWPELLKLTKEQAVSFLSTRYQPLFVIGSVMLYTIIMIYVMRGVN